MWGTELGAFHSLDIPFFLGHDTIMAVFQAVLYSWQNAPGRKALSAAMMGYLSRFARTGDPNDPQGNSPVWQPWSQAPGGPKYIIFDVKGNAPALRMSTEELTDEEVMAAARADLSEPLRKRTLDYLLESPLPSGVR
jgi:para-nitrobenzyl esterase